MCYRENMSSMKLKRTNKPHLCILLLSFVFPLFQSTYSDKLNDDSVSMADIIPRLFTSTFPTAVVQPYDDIDINIECIQDSITYTNALLKKTSWALKMYEATGKLPDSMGRFEKLRTHSMGLFDECLMVKAFNNRIKDNDQQQEDIPLFRGKYCTLMFQLESVQFDEIENVEAENQKTTYSETNFNSWNQESWIPAYQLPTEWGKSHQNNNNNITIKNPKMRPWDLPWQFPNNRLPSIGYCIPSSCTGEDFGRAVAQLVGKTVLSNVTQEDKLYSNASIVTLAGENYCYSQEMLENLPNFDQLDKAILAVFVLLGIIILSATIHEAWRGYNDRSFDPATDGFLVTLWNCFSGLKNGKMILSTTTPPSDISCLHGIRFLSTTWIIILHTHSSSMRRPSYNMPALNKEDLGFLMQGVVNSIHAVDSFFVLSGLLVSYGLLRELDRNKGRLNVPLFYLHRYLRLTPVNAAILVFIATMLYYLGTGPHWQLMVGNMREGCRLNWWNNLLYVNNYVNKSPPCMGETWYLACDMQMFWLSPLLIYPMWRWRRAGRAWVLTVTAVLIVATLVIYYIEFNFPPTDMFAIRQVKSNYWKGYYIQTWTRIPPYILGIAIGYILYKTKNTKVKIDKIWVSIGWILSTSVSLAIVYGLLPYLEPENKEANINSFVRISYGSLHRLAWTICLCWVVFACTHGYGGFVNTLLSWKAFVPLGKLTYVAYLFHWSFVKVHVYQSRKPFYYHGLDETLHYLAVLTLTFMASFVICLLIETPFLNLEKAIFNVTQQNGKNILFDSKATAESDARIKEDSITTLEMHHSTSVIEKDTIESG